MSICDLLNDGWGDGGPNSERFEEVANIINEMLESWGFEGVDIVDYMPPGYEDDPAVYMKDTDTIHLNPDIFEGDAMDAINLSLHEGLHASLDQLGMDFENFEEEFAVAGAGLEIGQELIDECQDKPTDSNVIENIDYPWVCEE